ncbi:MAG TPA: DUF2278 family protein [Frankiaceae bacterium]|nr:DUF2278 family protein [Frankiaceae bacterium]
MPLNAYGVAIGTYVSFHRDPPDEVGKWYHGHIQIATPAGQYTSAIDVDTKTGVGVAVKTIAPLDAALFAPVSGLANGWHALASNATSGALDYVRSELLLDKCPPPDWRFTPVARLPWYHAWYDAVWQRIRRLLCLAFRKFRGWAKSSGDAALTSLEQSLVGCRRVYIFGEHYKNGLGVHDVHMNQGDPAGSQWWASNGIWQDGGVVVQRADGTLAAWLVKFNSQSLNTDSQGHPV